MVFRMDTERSTAAELAAHAAAGNRYLTPLARLVSRIANIPDLRLQVSRGDIPAIQLTLRLFFNGVFMIVALIGLLVMNLLLFHEVPEIARLSALHAAVMIAVALLVRLTGRIRLAEHLALGSFFVYLVSCGYWALQYDQPNYVVWGALFVPVAFYLTGFRAGIVWIAAYFLTAISGYQVHLHLWHGKALPPDLVTHLVGMCLSIFLFMCVFEGMRASYYLLVRQFNERLQGLAITDQLTGIANRRRLVDVLEAEIRRAERMHTVFALVVFDLDHFKKINDTYGHGQGDETLQLVSTRVNELIRATDIVGRWGGEEFLMILPGTNAAGAFLLSNRVREAVAGHRFSAGFSVTLSFGITEYLESDTLDTLVDRADRALYRAKQKGRNRVEIQSGS